MTRVYTKISGKVAMYEVATLDPQLARETLQQELGSQHKSVILALVS